MAYTINKRRTRKGLAFDLYYRWKGQRYRPLLGYDLSPDEAEQLAIAMISTIHHGEQAPPSRSPAATLRAFLPTYWQALRVKNRVDLRRPEIILETHLLPRFGDRLLDSLTPEDGQEYIAARLDAKAAPGTIQKEWGVLMRILNLAVDFEKLDRNRLKRVQLPDVARRERVATNEELSAIQAEAAKRKPYKILGRVYDPAEFWRITQVAIHTGLREAKILEIDRSWLRQRDDGWWLILPPSRTRLKGTPRELPLNNLAYTALRPEVAAIEGPIFANWSADAFGHQWQRTCKAAKVQDLHFHDLRHTFTTRLQNLGVSLEIRSALLGHSTKAMMTSQYSHGGQGWNLKLREAVTQLETTYTAPVLSYGLSYEGSSLLRPELRKVANSAEDQRKGWWSQRDLNPCLSLERAPS
jgi:integrase